MLLKGKNAIITGTSRGIGRAILLDFAKQGANVFAHARKKTEEMEQYCAELSETYGVEIVPVYFDIGIEEEVEEGARQILLHRTNIDILVNNAASIPSVKLFSVTTMEEIRQSFEINFFGQIYLTQLISKRMIRGREGSIINISSCAGVDGNTGMIDYVSSKAALIGATKRLAIELGKYGIRVNAVAPGLTDTDMGGMMDEKLEKETLSHQIIPQKAQPDQIASTVTFLASDMSSHITGQVLRVDGGMLN